MIFDLPERELRFEGRWAEQVVTLPVTWLDPAGVIQGGIAVSIEGEPPWVLTLEAAAEFLIVVNNALERAKVRLAKGEV